jgi:hypothetical protein
LTTKRCALATLLMVAGCTATPSRPPSFAPETVIPEATFAVARSAQPTPAGTVPTCHLNLVAEGPAIAHIDGIVAGGARHNGLSGNGIDIDFFFDAVRDDGRPMQMLMSIWDPDSAAGQKPTSILYGPSNAVGLPIESGTTPEMGVAVIADDGSQATFDVHLNWGSKVKGTIECAPIP